jgi:hypothetical protein
MDFAGEVSAGVDACAAGINVIHYPSASLF